MTPFAVRKEPMSEKKPEAPRPMVAGPTSTSSTTTRKKYEMCKNFREKGECKYGDRCLFAHGDHELTRRGSPSEAEVKDEKKEEFVKVEEKNENNEKDETTLDSTKLQVSTSKIDQSLDPVNQESVESIPS